MAPYTLFFDSAELSMSDKRPALLLVDDDPFIAESLQYVLSDDYEVSLAGDRAQAQTQLGQFSPELLLVDLGLPPHTHKPDEGLALIRFSRKQNPLRKVLVLSGQEQQQSVKQALDAGADDFIAKPCDIAELKARIQHCLERPASNEDGLVGVSSALQLLREQIRQLADAPFPVLIEGESGSGKELVAQSLHQISQRQEAPFLSVNCAALNAELLESQLFGHLRGAFTGATETRQGFFAEAGEGTLFLDEIADLPLDLQAKLLRVLENGEYYRLGETKSRVSRARIVAASNKNLPQAIEQGRFREDLYHRLSVLTLHIPPLRERQGDPERLLQHFIATFSNPNLLPFSFDQDALKLWLAYRFPGNVRELRNIVIRLLAKYPGQVIKPDVLQRELQGGSTEQAASAQGLDDWQRQQLQGDDFQLDESLMQLEQAYIDNALQLADGNMSRAAQILGINRSTLYGRIERIKQGAGR